uniref:Uncharacterized protein n=1 Tax=Vespula pensylvanica TaxID=30213 RepID=A0A834NS50_VESPE|nr:hypothetical protein H0235_011491 [Vespula pensylvanica]
MKLCGGDALPLGGDIRRPPLANETGWWGYLPLGGDIRWPPLTDETVVGMSATRRRYKAAAFDSGSSHATNFYHTDCNTLELVWSCVIFISFLPCFKVNDGFSSPSLTVVIEYCSSGYGTKQRGYMPKRLPQIVAQEGNY